MQQSSPTQGQLADQLTASCRKKFALGTERLRAGDDALALLSLHGALEDGLRAYLMTQGIETSTSAWPDLIASLRADTQRPLSDDEAERLRRMNQLRNGVAHGEGKQPDRDGITSYSQFAAKLLRAYGIAISEQRAPRRKAKGPAMQPSGRGGQLSALLGRYSNVLIPGVVALLVFAVGLWALNGWLGRRPSAANTGEAGPILAGTAALPAGATSAATGGLSNQSAMILPSPAANAPTALPASAATPQAIPGAIAVGGRAVVNTQGDPLNLRSQPGQGADSAVIATLAPGTAVEVIAGPAHADDRTWWRVRAGQQEGWCAAEFLGVQAGP